MDMISQPVLVDIPDYIMVRLSSIITPNKPGELVNIDLQNIIKQYNIPSFIATNYFYLTNLNSHLPRGKHSNSNVSEILVCLSGKFKLQLHNGKNEVLMNINQHDAVYIKNNIWINFFDFEDCVILVIVSNDDKLPKHSVYDFDEYMRLQNS